MKASILTIGDEILIGQVINSNAAFIASKLSSLGVSIVEHLTTGDDESEIINALDNLMSKSDIIVVTCGLCPTHDDITKDVLAKYFKSELIFNEIIYKKIEKNVIARGFRMTERLKTMAYFPDNCAILENNVGQAPGMFFEKNNKLVFSLPGVPQEMTYIIENSVLAKVKEKILSDESHFIYHKTLLTTGIPESNLADLIQNAVDSLNETKLAFLPSYSGVRLRITSIGSNYEMAKQENERIEILIREKANEYIFGENDDTLQSILGKLLISKNLTVSTAESCTAGLLSGALTDMPGSSAYFIGGEIVYCNRIKTTEFNIPEELLSKYGAVSKETAELLAKNVRSKFETDLSISITGIAGPDGGSELKRVGNIFFIIPR